MMTADTQEALIGLIARFQSMRGSERRAILSRLGRDDRASLRRMIQALKTARAAPHVTEIVLVRLERAAYSDGLKRHLRRLLSEAGRQRPVTAATQAWLAKYLSSARPGETSEGPAADRSATQPAPAIPGAGPVRSAG